MTSTTSSPAEPRENVDARRTDTRQRILEVAGELFREKGYVATSTQNIADELGVTKAALYYHFERKEDILIALKEPVIEAVTEILSRPFDCTTPEGRRVLVTELIRALVDCGAAVASMMTEPQAQFEVRAAMESTGVPARVAGLLAAGLSGSTDPEDATPAAVIRVSATMGALHGALDGWVHACAGDESMADGVRDDVIEIVLTTLEAN